jgi:thiol-disulfide isomerase/thioredoxin
VKGTPARPAGPPRRALLWGVPAAAAAGALTWWRLEKPTGGADASTGAFGEISSDVTGSIQEIPAASRTEPLTLSGPALAEDPDQPEAAVGSPLTTDPGAGSMTVDVADFRGSVAVVNVWGSWCSPCRAEAPVLREAASVYEDRGVGFLGVNVKDTPAAARAFERRYSITYPSIDDSVYGRAFLDLRGQVPTSAIPSTLILDGQGRVAARVIGQISATTLRTLVDTVLDEESGRGPTS